MWRLWPWSPGLCVTDPKPLPHTARTSKGTKVFALAGNVARGGLIEIPMGTTIREIVEGIGGGVAAGPQIQGRANRRPSGGCVPARLADTPVISNPCARWAPSWVRAALVVLDDTACMVDIARYFLQFTQDQSCGKCTFCRIGTRRMLDILDRLCARAKASRRIWRIWRRLARQVGAGSLCGLGKTAPNPVLTTLRYFREEYEAHLQGRCPAGKCIRSHSIPRDGQLHRLHHLRPALPGRCHSADALCRGIDRSSIYARVVIPAGRCARMTPLRCADEQT